jgi:plastocyanin
MSFPQSASDLVCRGLARLVFGLATVGLVSATHGAVVQPGVISSSLVGQAYGTIKGRLVYGGASVPEPVILVKKGDTAVKDAAVCATDNVVSKGMAVDPKTKGIQYGVAYLVAPKGKNADLEAKLLAKAPKVEIDQKGCDFVPHVLALHKDQGLTFKSSDPVSHNIHYTAFANGDLNQMLAPNGQFAHKFAAAEKRACRLVCDIHPWMLGYFFVFDHPFFMVTAADGSFEIQGVPAGSQNLVVWHETGYVTPGLAKGMPVEVKAGETTDVGEIKLLPKK